MEKDTSKRIVGLFIVLIMFFSIAGYAAFSGLSGTSQQAPEKEPTQAIARVIDRELSNREKLLALNSGITLLEYFYTDGCGNKCEEEKAVLESIAEKGGNYVILQEIKGKTNTTHFQIITRDKADPTNAVTRKLDNFTEISAFDLFCSMALVQPKECLLRDLVG